MATSRTSQCKYCRTCHFDWVSQDDNDNIIFMYEWKGDSKHCNARTTGMFMLHLRVCGCIQYAAAACFCRMLSALLPAA